MISLVIAVLIAGTVGLNIMTAAVDSYRTFGNTARFAQAQVLAASVAAAVEGEPYVVYAPPTPAAGAYTLPPGAVPAGWLVTVGVENAADGSGTVSWSAQNADSGLQEVSVGVVSADGRVHAALSFLKDDQGG